MNSPDRLDAAIEKLLAEESPRAELVGLNDEELRMLQMAQLLRGSREASPRPEFVSQLRDQLLPQPRRISRRTAFLSGFGALAAGLLAGVGLDRATNQPAPPEPSQPLVEANNGRWIPVAQVAEVPHGAIRPFTAGAVQGFLINRNGQYRALSRICTHMGCSLSFQRAKQSLVCPCHGAEFNLAGHSTIRPRGYDEPLPSLPTLSVRVNGSAVEVWSV